MSKMFVAHKILIGACRDPECRAVHVQLLDKEGVPRAQAVIGCDELGAIVADMISVSDNVIDAFAKQQQRESVH